MRTWHIHTVSGKGFCSKIFLFNWTSTPNKSIGTQVRMVTWVVVGFHRGVIQRSWGGHLKVTTRSNLLKMVENSLFLLFLLTLCSLEMYTMS